MSTHLAKSTLCQDTADYNSLLANLSMAMELIDCDSSGNIANGPGVSILEKMFHYGTDGNETDGPSGELIWYSCSGSAFFGTPQDSIITLDGRSCFKNLDVSYYGKDCSIGTTPFIIDTSDPCYQAASVIVSGSADKCGNILGDLSGNTSFDQIADSFANWLGYLEGSSKPLNDVITVIKGFCNVIQQRVKAKKYLTKVALTISGCEL